MGNPDRLDLAQTQSGVLRTRTSTAMTIGALEAGLLRMFPAEDALEWDRTGLCVGDPAKPVSGVAVALDVTLSAIDATASSGANVLLTHHPAFLEPLEGVRAPVDSAPSSEALVWHALESGVALMNFHTALDVSREAAAVLPGMLGLEFERVLAPIETDSNRGFGQVCTCATPEAPKTLSELAARCTAVFGRIPRVYGNPSLALARVATCTGSAGDLPLRCLESGIDCLVCGEVRYHAALDASSAGLGIVEIGHDTSELPLCAVLAQAAVAVGVPEDAVYVVDQTRNWWTPEASRR